MTEFWRTFLKWTTAIALFIALLALLTSLQLFQATSEGASKRTLRRAIAALTEVDPLIERQYGDLQTRAKAAQPNEPVQLNDFPIAVEFSPAEVNSLSRPEFRELLLDRAADRMYAQGTAPLRANPGASTSVGRLSVAGLSDRGLGFLRERNHDALAVVTFTLAALCAFLAATLAALCRGFGRLASVGGVVLVAAIPVALGGIGARFYMRIVSEGDTEYIQREFLVIGQGLAWIPIRDGLAFAVLGAAFLVAGMLLARWSDGRRTSTSRRG